ncbi:MAG: hypothetical protein JWL81_3173 [Verrucomicrobiales bacterium]|nr:hypothetical protein [Verrucomicrobiales bacterium]
MSNAVVARRFVISAALTFLQCLASARGGSFVPIQWERVSSSNPLALLTYRAVQDPVLARIAAPVTAAPPYTILTPPNRIIRDFSMRLGFPFPNTYGALSYGDMDPTRAAVGLNFRTKLNFNRGDSTNPPNLVWGFQWGPGLSELGFTPGTSSTAPGVYVTVSAVPDAGAPGGIAYQFKSRVNGPGGYTQSDVGTLASDQPSGLMNDAPEDAPDGSLSVHIHTRSDGELLVTTEYLNASGGTTLLSSNMQFTSISLGNTLTNTDGWRAVTGCRSGPGNFHTCTMHDTTGGTEVASAAAVPSLPGGGPDTVNSQYGVGNILGNAAWVADPQPSGAPTAVRLVTDETSRLGQFFVAPGLQDMIPTRLTARVRLTSAGDPADGFAISWGEHGNNAGTFNEEGANTGLVYSFDIFQNTDLGEPAPGITARYNGFQIGYTALSPATMKAGGAYQDLEASLNPADAWVVLNGVRYYFPLAGNLTAAAPSPSHCVAVFSARTGGLSSEVRIGDVKVYASDYVKPSIALSNGILSQVGRLDYSTTMQPGSWTFTRNAISSFPIRALGHGDGSRVFYRATTMGRPTPGKN